MIESTTDYKSLPRLTSGDDAFREQFVSWDLGDLTFTDIQAYLKQKDVVLVPLASLEQHGPHLPLYTDTITAVEISRRVSEHIGVLHTPALWAGYSPQHMHEPGQGRGTITLRSSTLLALMYDVARSLIHHGFSRVVFVNGHGSNIKVVDPVLRQLRYETGALLGFVKPYMERYTGILKGLMENPPEETPGWHASELETSQDLAWNEKLVRMERAEYTRAHIPENLPETFGKKDGMPDVEFEGYTYFNFPMDHHEFIESGVIGNPTRATKEKGEEAFRRLSEHVARGVLELMKVPVTVHSREFLNRVM
jgi:creatinine amidohydrolase